MIRTIIAIALGIVAGGVTARAIDPHTPYAAWIVGLVLLGLAMYTTTLFAHPLWMVVATPIIALGMIFLATRLPLPTRK